MEIGNYNSKGEPVLTLKQKKFFSTPKTMQSVWKDLFHDDAFTANDFQSWAMTNNLIIWNGSTFIKK